jgi:type VI protein secretion system component VasF
MTLLELVEPLFQYVCRLNRVARKSGNTPTGGSSVDTAFFSKGTRAISLDYSFVRNEIKGLLEELQQKASSDFRLSSQMKKMELPLTFFVDSLIAESSLPFAAEWNQNRLAYERNELAGDEKFFDLLEEELKDQSEEASERLAVFYICLGLGFMGVHFRQPELLQRTMFSIAPRIRRWLDADEMARICPDAYEGVDTRDLTEPPNRKILVISLIFLCLTAAAIVAYCWLYFSSKQELTSSFKAIGEHNLSVSQPK